MNASNLFRQAGRVLKRHSPEILTGLGVAGLLATTVMAVKETPKALKLMEEKKQELEVEKLSPVETIKTTWKCYLPAAITCVSSVACVVGASALNLRRNAALVTAYTISETALKEYRDKTLDLFGEKKEQTIRDAIAKDQVEKHPVDEEKVIITGKGVTRCYDPWSDRYFDSDPEFIRRGVNDLNYQLLNDGYATLNDFYYSIGLNETKPGATLGWDINKGQVQFRFSSQIDTNDRPCLVLEFTTPPTYDYVL